MTKDTDWKKIGDLVARRDDSDGAKFVQVSDEGDGSTVIFDQVEAERLLAMFSDGEKPLRWEYSVRSCSAECFDDLMLILDAKLNMMAEDRWEPFEVIHEGGRTIVIFRRQRMPR